MATKKATNQPANVNPATVNAETKTAKINLVKEGKNTMNTNETKTATVNAETKTAPVSAPVSAPAETVTAPAPATVPTVDPVAVKRAEINGKIKNAKILYMAFYEVNKKGKAINPTNWGKTETGTGKETLGGFVRMMLNKTFKEINGLKLELKATYFTVSAEIKTLQDSENETVKALANACIDKMGDVVIFTDIKTLTAETLAIIENAGLKNIGIDPKILGEAIPVLTVSGYFMDMAHPQPVTVDKKEIEGLDPVEAYKYYGFKKS